MLDRHRPEDGRRRPRRQALLATLVALLSLTAACGGSALEPRTVLEANQAILGQAAAGSPGGAPAGSSPDSSAATDPGTAPVPGSAPGSTASTGSSSGTTVPGGSPAAGTKPGKPAGSDVKAASCDGFRNGPGITDSTITIGNAADVSGPVPGLFAGAQLATRAYVAYFNATNPHGICGRKLVLKTYDSRTDAGADQQAAVKMCEETFAGVGSMSVFDSGGAQTAQQCGYPDIRSASLTSARNACPSCFGVQATGGGEFTNPVYDFWVKRDKDATQKAAFLYLNTGAAATNAQTQIAVGAKRGMNWVYTAPIDVAEFNYGPYVQQMKSKGVQFVQFIGAYQQSVRLAQAMQSASFKPRVLMFDPSVYDPAFLASGGDAIDGAYMYITFVPLDSNQQELNLYRTWLAQVSPGAKPTFFGVFSWSAAKLFTQEALELGGRLDRAALVAKLASVNGWTGGGLHVPMSVGSKHAPTCARFMQVQGGKFVPYGGTDYLCTGYSRG